MSKSPIKQLKELYHELDGFERPEGDNEGSAWNGPEIFPFLPPEAQEIVEEIAGAARVLLVRQGDWGEEVNVRGLNLVRKHGCRADFGPAQYDANRNVGYIEHRDRRIDLSDPSPDVDEDPMAI